MGLRNIPYKSVYIVPRDNYVNDVLISSLKHATSLDCMFGFFRSAALRSIAPGLAEYLARDTQPMRLVVSPNISAEDFSALREGVSTPVDVIEARLKHLLGKAKISTGALVRHTLTCLAYMLANQRLRFRVAWLRDGSLFHPKVWFFKDANDTVVAHGSSNFTDEGLGRNLEQISVDMSWGGERSEEAIKALTEEFDALWDGSRDYIYTLDLPVVIENELIREYEPKRPPTTDDFQKAWEEDSKTIEKLTSKNVSVQTPPTMEFTIPPHLNLDEGPFSHQGKAIAAWEASERRGFLSMATGSGKTITALAAASRLQHELDSLLVIISAPYQPLVSQWVDEVTEFGVTPLPVGGSLSDRANHLDLAVRRLQLKVSRVEVMVVTENFLTSNNFRHVLDKLPESLPTLLIADEAHNLGKKSFLKNTPDRFDYRLGLSATPERQYDSEGTAALFAYFGEPVFEFSLREAIGVCLVPYNYYMHQVDLTNDEFSEWKSLTERLIRKGFKGDADASDSGSLPRDVETLLFARRRVIESAENKVEALRQLLKSRPRDDVKHVLVYATDKNPLQLRSVNEMLQNDLNLTIHQLTSEETANRARSSNILERFANGDYNALTCKRVLDEGVDVPQVSEAYILASNTVRRQWIQRRGRVLRKCDAINKQLAYLHDFIVVPPNTSDSGSRAILKGELERAREFAELSANGGSPGGPFDKIDKLMANMFN
ncbi:MAG: DEAD/DEAH box helicase family protein [Candidatus Dadabacteria bacterium]|nr:DEAD/DEAH box helicase family protein [Candidatus Dadabacteria bacterium]